MMVLGGSLIGMMVAGAVMALPRSLRVATVPAVLRRPLPGLRSRRVVGPGRRLWTGWKGVLLLRVAFSAIAGFAHTQWEKSATSGRA